MKTDFSIPGSFRDPSGFVFCQQDSVYRQVNKIYKDNYDHLMSSGLYEALVNTNLLVRHNEIGLAYAKTNDAYKVLKPDPIPFISYPYEWCFSQLKDAALATLRIQKIALDFGMTLKDSSAYNIQFLKGRPVLIDLLSFEKYREGQLWVPYRQFCQHFLAPLALMSYKDIRLSQLLRTYLDGIPLDLASMLLPFWTRFRFSLLSHVHLHAKSQKHFANKTPRKRHYKIGRISLFGLIDDLESATKRLHWEPVGTEWADYYDETNYSSIAITHKRELADEFLNRVNPKFVWDLGANTGLFSRMSADKGIETISLDIDPAAVERNYLECKQKGETNLLPLWIDLTNPSPGIGWATQERIPLFERGPADTVLALAIIHHLAISNNLPFSKIAEFLHRICKSLIIEFIPKSDSQVQRLLSAREDIFPGYTQPAFEEIFGEYFTVMCCEKIRNTERTLFLMQARR
jgi:hypothetical protein